MEEKIYNILTKNGFDVFLPKSINIEGKTKNEMEQIAYNWHQNGFLQGVENIFQTMGWNQQIELVKLE